MRHNVNRSLDPSFHSDPVATEDMGNTDIGTSVAIHPDGKIVAAGMWTETGD